MSAGTLATGRQETGACAPVPPVGALAQPEEGLVRRAQALDESALCSLFDTYYPKLYNYGLLQLQEAQAAEDLASDVMLKVLESIPKYRSRGVPLSAWVFRIARNRLVDIKRRGNRRREVGLTDRFVDGSATPHSAVERALDFGQVSLALCHLTEVQEQVIVLRFIKDLDVASVAQVLGRSESAVKSLQFRALTSLRRILQGDESANKHPSIPKSRRARSNRLPVMS
jgi:RNA polymerase sigma-70 factor (ECF subfamily)